MNNLIAVYQQRLNLQKAHFSHIDHDNAMVATVFKITQLDGAHFILKICSRTPDYLREVYFLNHFADQLPVPRIIELVEPEANVDGAILMEYLPGQLLKVEELNDHLIYKIGSLLALIHLSSAKSYGDLIQPSSLSSDPKVHFTMKFEEGLKECENHLPKQLIEKCRQYFDAHIHFLNSVDGPCIIHRDFRPGNIMINEGQLQGIIDWSSARAGFAEEDFCSIEFGEWSLSSSYKKLFLAGYASVRKIPSYERLMPLLRLSKAIAAIGFTVKRGIWNSKGSTIYKLSREFLETI